MQKLNVQKGYVSSIITIQSGSFPPQATCMCFTPLL